MERTRASPTLSKRNPCSRNVKTGSHSQVGEIIVSGHRYTIVMWRSRQNRLMAENFFVGETLVFKNIYTREEECRTGQFGHHNLYSVQYIYEIINHIMVSFYSKCPCEKWLQNTLGILCHKKTKFELN